MQPGDIVLWAVWPVTVALVLVSLEAGFRVGRRRRLKAEAKYESTRAMVGATMGLLAFMLAFAFNSSSNHHQDRSGLVIEEANAIRKAWQKAQFLPESHRTEALTLLREYLDVRVNAAAGGQSDLRTALERTEALQDRLVSLALAVERTDATSNLTGPFVESLDDVFDLHLKRVTAGMRNLIPSTIWVMLYVMTVVTMAMAGYQIGVTGSRHGYVELALALAFSAVIYLIADLDHPQSGMIRVDQRALVELRDKMGEA